MDVRLMKRHEVCKALATSSSGLHRGMKAGIYPKPYRTTDHSVRWKSNEIQEVIDKLQIAVPIEVAPGGRKGRKQKNKQGAEASGSRKG